MMRKPEIVMAQVSDQWRPGQGTADIVRRALLAPVALQVNKPHPPVRLDISSDDLRGVVGASVSDHNQFPIAEGLLENALDCISQHPAAVVGCDHDRNPRTGPSRPMFAAYRLLLLFVRAVHCFQSSRLLPAIIFRPLYL